mgnify:CR=1 FL=1
MNVPFLSFFVDISYLMLSFVPSARTLLVPIELVLFSTSPSLIVLSVKTVEPADEPEPTFAVAFEAPSPATLTTVNCPEC